MEETDFELKSGSGTLFIGNFALIFCVLFGLSFLVLKFKDPQPSDEIRVVVSLAFIVVGVVIFVFTLIRSTNKLLVTNDSFVISKFLSKDSFEWGSVQSIYIKFTGKSKFRPSSGIIDAVVEGVLDGLSSSNELGSIVVKITTGHVGSNGKDLTIKFTNRSIGKVVNFIKLITSITNVEPEFTDHKKKFWTEYSWLYSLSP